MNTYQLSRSWILRYDEHHNAPYTLFDINRGYEYVINHSIFSFLSFMEQKDRGDAEISDLFEQNDVDCAQIVKRLNKQWKGLIINKEEVGSAFSFPKLSFSPKISMCSSPKTAEILLTTLCNLECLHCVHSCGHQKEGSLLSGREWIEILQTLERSRIQKVVLTGGEIFTHPHIDEIVEVIGKMKIRFILLTNAMLITKERAELLNKSNIVLSVSLDGNTEQSHDFLRGRGAYNTLMKRMQFLKEYNVNRMLSVTLHAKNTNNIQGIIDYALKENVKAVNFTILDEVGRAKEHEILHLSSIEREKCKDQVRNIQVKYKNELPIFLLDPAEGLSKNLDCSNYDAPIYCTGATSHIAISPTGDVYPCVYGFGESSLCSGNLKYTSLSKIWNTDKWNMLRGDILLKDLHTCKACSLSNSCQTKNCRVRALKYKRDLYGVPNCIACHNV